MDNNYSKNNKNNYESSTKSEDSGIVIAEDNLELDNNYIKTEENLNEKFNDKNYENILTKKDDNNDVILNNVSSEDSLSIKSNTSSSIISNDSQQIYINSINLNDNESYILNSDSDNEFDNNNCIVRKLGEHSHKNGENPIDNVQIVKQEIDNECNDQNQSSGLNINHLAISGNTSDVTVGNKYIFERNVIIKQFVIEKEKENDINTTEGDNGVNLGDKNGNSNQSRDNKNSTFLGILAYKLKSRRNIVILATIIIFLITILAIVGWKLDKKNSNSSSNHYQIGDGDDSRKNIPIYSTIGDDIIKPGQFLRLISRTEWLAQPPNGELVNLTLPVGRVIIAHTATEPCSTQASCTFHVRYIQTFHIESRGFDDIAYNYLVGGDGAVYEGRGWEKMGAHTKGYNVDSICIAFIGTFNTVIPPDGQMSAALLIIREGLKLGKIKQDFKLYGHRQLIATESPGVALFKILQKWPHFATELESINPIETKPKNSSSIES